MPRKPGDFENNDDIYIRLNEHDSENVEEKRRAIEEMIDEAKLFRNVIEKS